MADDDIEDAIASFRTTVSGEEPTPEETFECSFCGRIAPISEPCSHSSGEMAAAHGEQTLANILMGGGFPGPSMGGLQVSGLSPMEPIGGVAASGQFMPAEYGVSIDEIVASEPQMSQPAPGVMFLEPSLVHAPAVPSGLNVYQDNTDSAFVIAAEGKQIVKIKNDGTVVLDPETTINEAAQSFWDAVQLHGPRQAIQELEGEKTTLEARVKELEIKLGYRKDDKTEEDKGRFKEILDE